jgi:hypothetical protein
MASPVNGLYRVVCSQAILQQLRTLLAGVPTDAARVAFRDALRTINRRLRTEPMVWGEPWYHLRQMGLTMFHGMLPLFGSFLLWMRFAASFTCVTFGSFPNPKRRRNAGSMFQAAPL